MDRFQLDGGGFVAIERDSSDLTYKNVKLVRNQVSPFHSGTEDLAFDCSCMAVDSYYGLGYDADVTFPRALYGLTSELPSYAGDSLANRGFLRVPFRRVPRILVRDRRELAGFVASIQSADASLRMLFRGQRREYCLQRVPDARALLYGDPDVIEPSLLPSASRADLRLETIGPEWSAMVQIFLGEWIKFLARRGAGSVAVGNLELQRHNLVSGYALWAFHLALAQHYGLPSAGLDVTSELDVALFFALADFASDGSPANTLVAKRGASHGEPPVIYIFAKRGGFFVDFNDVRPVGFPTTRPDAQRARFLHTGWGLASNVAAQNLFVALYLDPAGDWGRLPRVSDLFPGRDGDPFGAFLNDRALGVGSPEFRRFMQRFYWVIDPE